MTDIDKKHLAYSLGVQAFKAGKARIPAQDKILAENCLKGNKVGEGIPYLKAWLRGWDESNLQINN